MSIITAYKINWFTWSFCTKQIDDTKYFWLFEWNISSSKLDRQKPLFGLVETCFDGMGYKALKDSVVLEMKRISNILSQWLEIQSLSINPL